MGKGKKKYKKATAQKEKGKVKWKEVKKKHKEREIEKGRYKMKTRKEIVIAEEHELKEINHRNGGKHNKKAVKKEGETKRTKQ